MTSAYDPNVLISAAIMMQRIGTAVAKDGHTHYVRGVVPAHKALALAQKMNARWELNLSADQRSRRSKQKKATFLLFFCPIADSQAFEWVLLRRRGDHPEMETERWVQFAKKPRFDFRGLELLRVTYTAEERAKFAQRKRADKEAPATNSWTWRMTSENFESFKKRIRSSLAAVKRSKGKNDMAYRQVLHAMKSVPGFRSARTQVFELRGYVLKQQQRLKLPFEQWGPMPRYLRYASCAKYPLSLLVHRASTGADSWFPAAKRGTPSGIITKLSKEANHADQEALSHQDES